MEKLEAFDRWLVLLINGANSEFFDDFFWIVSGKATWIPFYLLLVFFVYKSNSKQFFLWFCIGALLSVALADFTSAQIIKENIARYRPSHNLLLEGQLHFHQFENGTFYQGGQYGFVSNHATNSAVVLFWSFIGLWSKHRWLCFFSLFVTLIVCYSRIYLGVHYLTDILGGLVWGTAVSSVVYLGFRKKKILQG